MKKSSLKWCFILILFGESAVFAEGLADWKVQLFAGPGKSDGEVYSLTVNDWDTPGRNKIYGIHVKQITREGEGQMEIPIETFMHEYVWTGISWSKKETPMPFINEYWNCAKSIGFYELKGTGQKSLYVSTVKGAVYECSYNGHTWNIDVDTQVGPNVPIDPGPIGFVGSFTVGTKGSENYLYKAVPGYGIAECKWENNTWNVKSGIGCNSSINSSAGLPHILVGNAHNDPNDNKTYVYYFGYMPESRSDFKIYESVWETTPWQETLEDGSVTWKGPGWKNNSEISAVYPVCIGTQRPEWFIADVGNGKNLYLNIGGGFAEITWKDNRWRKKDILITDQEVKAITYGKISYDESDPVAIYVLVSAPLSSWVVLPGDNGPFCEFSRSRADEIHEYTYNKDRRKWQRTYKIQLFEEGMREGTLQNRALFGAFCDLCMTNGRNEKITIDGQQVDKYQRLYIADSWGNLWECSIPPRKERPDYRPEDAPTKKPTITGE